MIIIFFCLQATYELRVLIFLYLHMTIFFLHPHAFFILHCSINRQSSVKILSTLKKINNHHNLRVTTAKTKLKLEALWFWVRFSLGLYFYLNYFHFREAGRGKAARGVTVKLTGCGFDSHSRR